MQTKIRIKIYFENKTCKKRKIKIISRKLYELEMYMHLSAIQI